jgi:hypothetical protein
LAVLGVLKPKLISLSWFQIETDNGAPGHWLDHEWTSVTVIEPALLSGFLVVNGVLALCPFMFWCSSRGILNPTQHLDNTLLEYDEFSVGSNSAWITEACGLAAMVLQTLS